MNSRTRRVLQRLAYEGYMHSTAVNKAKTHFTLRDIIESGAEEPRLFELLPGLINYDSRIIKNIKRDFELNQEFRRAFEALLRGKSKNFYGVPAADCLKQMQVVQKIAIHKSTLSRTRNLNIRISEQDFIRLAKLAKFHRKTKSEVIRSLLATQTG